MDPKKLRKLCEDVCALLEGACQDMPVDRAAAVCLSVLTMALMAVGKTVNLNTETIISGVTTCLRGEDKPRQGVN